MFSWLKRKRINTDDLYLYHSLLPPPGKEILLAKLEDGNISLKELDELEYILKWEAEEARCTDQGMALIAIMGILGLVGALKKYKGGLNE